MNKDVATFITAAIALGGPALDMFTEKVTPIPEAAIPIDENKRSQDKLAAAEAKRKRKAAKLSK